MVDLTELFNSMYEELTAGKMKKEVNKFLTVKALVIKLMLFIFVKNLLTIEQLFNYNTNS